MILFGVIERNTERNDYFVSYTGGKERGKAMDSEIGEVLYPPYSTPEERRNICIFYGA